MLARPELLLPLAFAVSGLLIVAALVLLGITMRQARQIQHVGTWRGSARLRTQKMVLAPAASFEGRAENPHQWKRATTQHMFSGATAAALDEMTRPNPARQRQVRMYS